MDLRIRLGRIRRHVADGHGRSTSAPARDELVNWGAILSILAIAVGVNALGIMALHYWDRRR
jgi:hypothetical protein